MFEDLINKRKKPKLDCPFCKSIVVVHYGLNEHHRDYGKGNIYAYNQRSYCMKCNKKWFITYDDKMNIRKINDKYVSTGCV